MSEANAAAAFYDAAMFCGFALGLCCCRGFLRTLIALRRGIGEWLFETVFFAVWGALAFLFILGETRTREPRSFMAAGALAGAAAYRLCFRGAVTRAARCCRRVLQRLFSPFAKAANFFGGVLGRVLKAANRIVYNVIHGSKGRKTESARVGKTAAGTPRRAYAQTARGADGAVLRMPVSGHCGGVGTD